MALSDVGGDSLAFGREGGHELVEKGRAICAVGKVPGSIAAEFGNLAFKRAEALLEAGSKFGQSGNARLASSMVLDFDEGEDHFHLLEVTGLVGGLGLVPPFQFGGGEIGRFVRMEAAGKCAVEFFEAAVG